MKSSALEVFQTSFNLSHTADKTYDTWFLLECFLFFILFQHKQSLCQSRNWTSKIFILLSMLLSEKRRQWLLCNVHHRRVVVMPALCRSANCCLL